MRRRRKNIFAKSYHNSFAYLAESRNYIYLAIVLFVLSSFIGYYFHDSFSVYLNPLIKDLIDRTAGLNASELIVFIFTNNFFASFIGLISGVLFGIFPIFNILLNGVLLGYVLALAVSLEGWFSIFRLLPHGVFELPAIFISIGLGIKIGGFIFARGGRKIFELKRRLINSIFVFIEFVLPLLVIAAIIEGLLISFFG